MGKIRLRDILHSHREKELGPPSDSHFYAPYIGGNQTLVILDLLERLKPRKCLEWGSGWSTVLFPRFTPGAAWISIEHLPYYVKLLTPHLRPNVKLLQVPIHARYVGIAADWVKDQPFDFVFVDGERRPECLKMASQILRKEGIVVLHDAAPTDRPIMLGDEDVRAGFEEHGLATGLWWGRK